jgi:chaperonin GroES
MTIEFTQIPINDMVVVEMLQEHAAKGRIKLPEWQKYLRGIVIAAGPGRALYTGERGPMQCKVGDEVSFAPTAGMDIDYGSVGASIRLMRDPDIDCVWEAE